MPIQLPYKNLVTKIHSDKITPKEERKKKKKKKKKSATKH